MYVENIFINGRLYERKDLPEIKDQEEIMLLLQAFALNNDAIESADTTIRGDSTEVALLEVAREQNVQTGKWPRMAELAFDAERKLMTTFHSHEDKIISFTKGAPDTETSR